uniref:NADH-ubiquinone oxidoreductase chain 6 n=1 Tax=Calliopsida cinnabarina TaxID=2219944 RepID=A0A3S7MGB5_9HEMI|nr:NADH dehydrogenase subunit 6 [Calliopsida cinnabarina]
MKIVFVFSMFFNLIFMLIKHPLSMGSVLLLQTIFMSILCGLNMKTYMMSYILFLIFIGGMLVLFMYMSSIASNEKFYMINIVLTIITLVIMSSLIMKMQMSLKCDLFSSNIMLMNLYSSFMMDKLYSLPSGLMTLMIVIYLLFTLVVVSNIVGIKFSPLRSYI